MKLEADIYPYLRGEKFTNSLTLDLGKEKYSGFSRESVITGMIKGRDVIHLGCADHVEIIEEKVKADKWLHKLISDNARNCLGIDIDEEGINYLKSKLGYSNVFAGNIMTDSFPGIMEKRWDYVVFGELIEHLDNPVEFLKTFKDRFGEYVSGFIITVPNVYSKRQIRNIRGRREVINSDHRFWFTPYTVSKILVSAGYSPEAVSFANLQLEGFFRLAIRKLRRIAGIEEKYHFNSFSTIVISGKL